MTTGSLTVGSLFSGIGGFDLGLERAGHRVLWQVEYDARCRSVLRRHWPSTDIYEDVCNVGRTELVPVDLVCGGFPCQDLSVAGRRAGLDGERSGLWFEFHRIVSELLPTWVLVENVPGLRSSAGGRDLAVILRGLAELGYLGAGRSLDSQYLGVAQRRERIFLLACRDPRAGCPAEVLALAEGLSGHPAPSRETGERIAGTITGGAGTARPGGGRHEDTKYVASAITRREAKGPDSDATSGFVVAHALTAEGFDAGEDGTGRGTPIIAFNATQDPISDELIMGALSDQGAAVAFQESQSGFREVATHPTLDSHNGSRRHHGVATTIPRRLTPTECERLQGFPDGWTALDDKGREIADGPRYRMLGNAVTVHVAEWIGHRLAHPHDGQPNPATRPDPSREDERPR